MRSGDADLLRRAVEELLRYLNITHTGRRRVALEDIEIGGEVIRAGEGVIAAGDVGEPRRAAFAEPDRLDVTREARHHVAFGYGVHQCLGQTLARVELQVVYGTLYRRSRTSARGAGGGAGVQGRHARLRRALPAGDVVKRGFRVPAAVRRGPRSGGPG